MSKPVAIDLFCGLGGWAEGFLALEGFERTPEMKRQHTSHKRAQASAEIAMIPPLLARYIARSFYPKSAPGTRTSHLKPGSPAEFNP